MAFSNAWYQKNIHPKNAALLKRLPVNLNRELEKLAPKSNSGKGAENLNLGGNP